MATKLFVANLAFQMTEGDVKKLFSPFGAVQEVKVIEDSITRRSKCYAFVVMNSLESAQEAIRELNNCTLSGRQLKVDLATGSTPEDRSIGNTVLEQRKRKRRAEGDEVCFDLLNGHCKRGSSCKFLHCLQEASAGSHNSTHVPSTRCTQEISVMRLRGSREDSHNRSRSSDQASRKDRTPRRFDKAKERISIADDIFKKDGNRDGSSFGFDGRWSRRSDRSDD